MSPNLNAYAERWVRSAKEECLSKVILFGERSLHMIPPEKGRRKSTSAPPSRAPGLSLWPLSPDINSEFNLLNDNGRWLCAKI
jgi:hypothetical protein